ncbi:Various polyols ABC transporter, periplasmic substrate-binding protein [Devosia sp. LC5]|uniref:extracellular solute-binding protein n=1 Tax=Devosia sp. LC5 TaxID=1502724 RepID=UPI0004E355E0|nr:extracellular solute-binding protein [Devosia sp. LC5]KFC69708.1 Various polyols ABC transporter, periplasmic substrate-binding protein [Devosia sp. LC5]
MLKKNLLTTVAAIALAATTAMPAHAEVTFMYAEWLSSLVEPGIKNFEAETGETVNAIKLPGQGYDQRIALDLSAGTAADVIQMDSFMVSELASAGYLQPLDEQAAGWDQYQYYMKGLLEVASYDGKVYALPTDTDVRMLWYSKPNFEKAGIPMPWEPKSWADILDAAQKLKDAGVEYAFQLPAGTKQAEAATMQGFYMALLGADVPEGDRNRLLNRETGQWIGDSPAIRRTLELYHEVYTERQLTPADLNYATDIGVAVRQALRDGKVGILASGSWEDACLWDCNGVNLPSREERDALVGWTPWPGSGEPGTKATTNISGGWTIGVNANAADKDLAFKLVTSIFDEANFKAWTLANHRMAVRTDISESPEYMADTYLAKATALAADTTGRDTVPGYQTVSALVQQATSSILDGASVEDVVQEYHDALVDEFGADKVITYE